MVCDTCVFCMKRDFFFLFRFHMCRSFKNMWASDGPLNKIVAAQYSIFCAPTLKTIHRVSTLNMVEPQACGKLNYDGARAIVVDGGECSGQRNSANPTRGTYSLEMLFSHNPTPQEMARPLTFAASHELEHSILLEIPSQSGRRCTGWPDP